MSVGLYVHFPFCRSRCSYCAFVSQRDFSLREAYFERLKAELEQRRVEDGVSTVYFGGGTPSTVPDLIERAAEVVGLRYRLMPDSEFTVECNPDSADNAFIAALRRAGCNRVSVGLQSAEDGLLSVVGRRHDFARFLRAVDDIRAAGILNVSADIMLGLPGQTLGDVESTLAKLLPLKLPHISVYGLAVERGTPLFTGGYRPDEDLTADMYALCFKTLVREGYLRYEVSNFALPGMLCRHNADCWQMRQYLGFGAAAHSYYRGVRSYNTDDIAAYIGGAAAEKEDVSADFVKEYVMLGLRTAVGIDLKLLRSKGCDLIAEKGTVIEKYEAGGLLIMENDTLRLSDDAYYIMNGIIADLI